MSGMMLARFQDTAIAAGDYIRWDFRDDPNAAKTLAEMARCSHRTTQDWLQGRREPSGRHLAFLMLYRRFRFGWFAWVRGQRDRAADKKSRLLRDIDVLRAEIERIEAMLRERGERDGMGKSRVPRDRRGLRVAHESVGASG